MDPEFQDHLANYIVSTQNEVFTFCSVNKSGLSKKKSYVKNPLEKDTRVETHFTSTRSRSAMSDTALTPIFAFS